MYSHTRSHHNQGKRRSAEFVRPNSPASQRTKLQSATSVKVISNAEELVAPIRRISADLELSVEDMKSQVVDKIEREMNNSKNAREFISKKYDDLCGKIKVLSDLNSTVTSFRGELKCVERAVNELQFRMDNMEKRVQSSTPALSVGGVYGV